MKHYLIYEIKNNLNGMIYVGKHVTDDINDSYMGSGLRIKHAIEKYGIENFEKTILFECGSEEEMNKKEVEIVNEDFIARDDVYNMKLGGDGGWKNLSFQAKSAASKRQWSSLTASQKKKRCQKISNTLKGTHYSEERRKQHSLDLARTYQADPTKNGMFGKKHSVKSKKKMSKSHLGKNNNQYGKMWICNDKTHESKTILKSETIPDGWRKGRICK